MTYLYITMLFRGQTELIINAACFHGISLAESVKNIPQCLHQYIAVSIVWLIRYKYGISFVLNTTQILSNIKNYLHCYVVLQWLHNYNSYRVYVINIHTLAAYPAAVLFFRSTHFSRHFITLSACDSNAVPLVANI